MCEKIINLIDTHSLLDNCNERARWNRIKLCDLVICYDGKDFKLTQEQIEFYTCAGLSNIDVVLDVLDQIE